MDPESIGRWSFDFQAADDPELWLNDLQVLNPKVIPEPGALALLSMAAVAILAYTWGSRKQPR